jgi:2-keto-3-deoxy-L-rhamnonate aldolase RhmA
MFTIEWANGNYSYSPTWETSTKVYETAETAATAAADWLLINNEHGRQIVVRLKTVEAEAPVLAVAA